MEYTKETQDFLARAEAFYRERRFRGCVAIYFTRVNRELVDWLYKLGRDYCVLPMDYWKFRSLVIGEWKIPKRRYSYRSEGFYQRHGVGYREKLSQVNITAPKSPTTDHWRELKGFERDYRKHSSHSRRRHPGHFWKRNSSRLRRAYEKEFIRQEQWDNYTVCRARDYKDPWRWD